MAVPAGRSTVRLIASGRDSLHQAAKARAGLPVAGPRRLTDPNVTADERTAIRRLLELEGVPET